MKNLDFTLSKYEQLGRAIIKSGYKTTTVKDYLINSFAPDSYIVILRHDIDRKPENALKIATLEKRLGMLSTYYFRTTKSVFKENIIKKITDLGHEIGYHYETLSKTKGDYEKAIQLFQKELANFRKIVDVSTICMHGNPFSQFDNRSLWQKYDFTKFNILGEAYLSIDYKGILYMNDTGRSWSRLKYNIYDKANDSKDFHIESTDDLIKLIKTRSVKKYSIQSHPNRWSDSIFEYWTEYLKDSIINIVKIGFSKLRI